jgi:MazG family protein
MADARALEALGKLVDVMARLRGPGGCPWDREQTPETLRPYILEEAYEVLEAIDRGDAASLRDELGDLLLQVVFQAELAAEGGRFTIADVAQAITDKLERRHPHVFGSVQVDGADDVVRNWKRIKAEERRAAGDDALFAGVPAALPALARAQQLGERAAQSGLDWEDTRGPLEKVREELGEIEAALAHGDREGAARELGDLLLAVTSVARHLDVPAEMALRGATTASSRGPPRGSGGARDPDAARSAHARRRSTGSGSRQRPRPVDRPRRAMVAALPRGESCVSPEAAPSEREAPAAEPDNQDAPPAPRARGPRGAHGA